MADMVNNPPHYKDASGIECIEVTRHMGFCGGNCFKYIYRAGKKGSTIEDLEKALFYAEEAYDLLEEIDTLIVYKIREVARYREGFIYKAMIAVRWAAWSDVQDHIQDEIKRLKNKDSK